MRDMVVTTDPENDIREHVTEVSILNAWSELIAEWVSKGDLSFTDCLQVLKIARKCTEYSPVRPEYPNFVLVIERAIQLAPNTQSCLEIMKFIPNSTKKILKLKNGISKCDEYKKRFDSLITNILLKSVELAKTFLDCLAVYTACDQLGTEPCFMLKYKMSKKAKDLINKT